MHASQDTSRIDAIGIIVCLLIGVMLRLVVVSYRPEQLTQDRDAYLGIATSIAEGRGYSSPNSSAATAFRPPIYPLSLAAGLRFFPPPVVVGGINVLSGLITVWLTLSLGFRLQLGWRRFIAAMLVALDPLLIAYTVQPMTESLCTLLATLWLGSLISACPNDIAQSPVNSVCGGIAFGLLVLCRPTYWLIPIVYGLICLRNFCRTAKDLMPTKPTRVWSNSLWTACGTVLVVAPWVIRNGIVLGVPILTTTHGGYTLLLGNNPAFYQEVIRQPWGAVWHGDSLAKWQAELESQIERDLGAHASEVARDNWHSQQAKRNIAANPRLFGQAVVHRIRSLWNTVPQGDTADGASGWIKNAVGWFYALVLTAGGLGLIFVLRREDRIQWIPLYVLIASVQLAHLVYWTNARMRAPLTPAIALFAAAVIPGKRRFYPTR